jgi:cell wall assembly regulator SMI1
MLTPEKLKRDLDLILKTLTAQGFDTRALIIEPPATEHDLRSLENDLGKPLPQSLRDTLLTVSSHVEFRWFMPDDQRFPPPFASNFYGDLHWSLDFLRQFDRDRQSWVDVCFPDPANAYDRVWHDKLAFHEVGNGDYIAIDLSPERQGEVVYLSHDDGEGHGKVLAKSFAIFLEDWVRLGCPGGEDWQWMHFLGQDGIGLDPTCDHARAWRTILKLTEI